MSDSNPLAREQTNYIVHLFLLSCLPESRGAPPDRQPSVLSAFRRHTSRQIKPRINRSEFEGTKHSQFATFLLKLGSKVLEQRFGLFKFQGFLAVGNCGF